jgi:RND family efflux transporter MFP subunit
MKIMKHIFSLLFLTILITSCGNKEEVSTDLSTLNAEKEILKHQLDSINTKLQVVEEAISKSDTIKKLAVVTTISPKTQDFNHYLEVQGSVKADKSVELHPEMGGTITRIYVKEGQRVSRGQTLAQLDASILNNNIAQMQTQLNLAITAFERQSRLWEQKIGSEMQYLQAKAQKEGLESNLRALQSQARKMKIIAPFSGTIDEVFAKQGELANPQMPFLRLINLSKVYIESEITETYLKDVQKGTNVIINFASINKEMSSKISQVGNFINPNNRSFKTRIDISNSNNEIKANQLADIKINDFSANGIVISSHVILKDRDGNSFVYTISKNEEERKVNKTIIKVAKEYNNQSYISEGLTEDDLIIDKGSRSVKSDDEVLIAQ